MDMLPLSTEDNPLYGHFDLGWKETRYLISAESSALVMPNLPLLYIHGWSHCIYLMKFILVHKFVIFLQCIQGSHYSLLQPVYNSNYNTENI